MLKWYNPELSIESAKRKALEERYEKFVAIMRSKGIYRKVVIRDFVFLRNEFNHLEIYYADSEHDQVYFNLGTYDGNVRKHGWWTCSSIEALGDDRLTDEEFVKVIKRMDELLNSGEFNSILDKLYNDVDDKTRLASLKAKLA